MHGQHQVIALGYIWHTRNLRRENAGSGWLSIAETEPVVVVVAVVRVIVVTVSDTAVSCIVVPVATAQQSPWRHDL